MDSASSSPESNENEKVVPHSVTQEDFWKWLTTADDMLQVSAMASDDDALFRTAGTTLSESRISHYSAPGP